MKYNVYTIVFNERLIPDQKRMIESSIEAVQEKIIKSADSRLENISKIKKGWRGDMLKRIPGGMAGLEAIEAGRSMLKANATKYLYYEWPDDSTMKFYYCSERLKNLPVIDESRILKGFRKFIFPDMKLSADPLVSKETVEIGEKLPELG